ncbi:MAG: phosphatase PAP2 family protein [Bacteriovoracia bacterium]
MKAEWLAAFRRPPKLAKRDILLTLAPIVGIVAAFLLRPAIMDFQCKHTPEECARESVNWLDRKSMGVESPQADFWSDVSQNTAGILAATVPLALQLGRAAGGGVSLAVGLAYAGTDILIFVQAALWNSFANEITRLAVQRPRPFVYRDPVTFGGTASDYTSFYSGHTSFATVAMLSLVFSLLGRGVTMPWLTGWSLTGLGFVFFTALTRVLAGRHFMSDVVVGMIVGAVITVIVRQQISLRSRANST